MPTTPETRATASTIRSAAKLLSLFPALSVEGAAALLLACVASVCRFGPFRTIGRICLLSPPFRRRGRFALSFSVFIGLVQSVR